MEREIIAKYLENIFKLFNIPILYVYDGEIRHRFEPYTVASYPMEWNAIYKRILQSLEGANADKQVFFHVDNDMIFSAFLRSKTQNDCVLLGPFALNKVTKKNIEDFLFSHALTAEASKKLATHFSGNNFLNLERCIYLLTDINLILNGEMLRAEDLLLSYFNSETTFMQKPSAYNYPPIQDIIPDNSGYPEAQNHKIKMQWCISHGEPSILQSLINDLDRIPIDPDEFNSMTVQESKTQAIGSIAIGRSLAEQEGVAPDRLKHIQEGHLNRILCSSDRQFIHKCVLEALVSFAQAVQESNAYHTKNPTINRVIQYIQANVNNKIGVPDILQSLKINRTYLFENFKKETGKSITEFITEEKIKRSVFYLKYTDNSIIEIAHFFSFSSQSYYQTTFKKVMGCTPTEYRQRETS